VALGTVTSVREAVVWLSYTYLYVRMCRNPLAYGIPFEQTMHDPRLHAWRTELVQTMARRLDECRMVSDLSSYRFIYIPTSILYIPIYTPISMRTASRSSRPCTTQGCTPGERSWYKPWRAGSTSAGLKRSINILHIYVSIDLYFTCGAPSWCKPCRAASMSAGW